MKKTYISPQTDITTLGLKGSVLDVDPPVIGGSTDTDEGGSNNITFEEEDFEATFQATPNLWDE